MHSYIYIQQVVDLLYFLVAIHNSIQTDRTEIYTCPFLIGRNLQQLREIIDHDDVFFLQCCNLYTPHESPKKALL